MAASPDVDRRVRNRIGWRHRLARLRGTPIQFDLVAFDETVAEIGRLEEGVADLSDDALANQARALRAQASDGTPLEALRAPFFALVREVARRASGHSTCRSSRRWRSRRDVSSRCEPARAKRSRR